MGTQIEANETARLAIRAGEPFLRQLLTELSFSCVDSRSFEWSSHLSFATSTHRDSAGLERR